MNKEDAKPPLNKQLENSQKTESTNYTGSKDSEKLSSMQSEKWMGVSKFIEMQTFLDGNLPINGKEEVARRYNKNLDRSKITE